ncbi:MAG: hypothetical protein KatS3mg031_2163 [Chitinophagales bacterium]|nr:MAG: hypothetical protein KatS3mg031_2163 [Chitinophagales bacterium]
MLIASDTVLINEKGLELYAWCIMTSHVHLIIGTAEKNGMYSQGLEKMHIQKVAGGDYPKSTRKQTGMDVVDVLTCWKIQFKQQRLSILATEQQSD